MGNLFRAVTPARRALAAAACALVLGLGVLGVLNLSRKRSATAMASSVQETEIPPIDAAVPAKTETATFALG